MLGKERISDLNRQQRQKQFDDNKHMIRKLEGLIDVVILTIIYYFLWQFAYDQTLIHKFYGNGKYLLITVYALLTYILLLYGDGFKF